MAGWDKDRPGGLPDAPVPLGRAEREAMALLNREAGRAVRRVMLLWIVVPASACWALGFGFGVAVGWWLL